MDKWNRVPGMVRAAWLVALGLVVSQPVRAATGNEGERAVSQASDDEFSDFVESNEDTATAWSDIENAEENEIVDLRAKSVEVRQVDLKDMVRARKVSGYVWFTVGTAALVGGALMYKALGESELSAMGFALALSAPYPMVTGLYRMSTSGTKAKVTEAELGEDEASTWWPRINVGFSQSSASGTATWTF